MSENMTVLIKNGIGSVILPMECNNTSGFSMPQPEPLIVRNHHQGSSHLEIKEQLNEFAST